MPEDAEQGEPELVGEVKPDDEMDEVTERPVNIWNGHVEATV